MSGIVLDAGALIALERNDRKLWAALKDAALSSTDVLVPSTVLAQVWRGTATQSRLSQALAHCVIVSFDAVARAVGELCGRAKTNDICDAHVAVVTVTLGETLYTSDPRDLRELIAAYGRKQVVMIRC